MANAESFEDRTQVIAAGRIIAARAYNTNHRALGINRQRYN
jgi:hypothetical protein